MYLFQILVPLAFDSENPRTLHNMLECIKHELTDLYGGVTAFSRAPAEGLWEEGDNGQPATKDDIVVVEVMAEKLDRKWWTDYRKSLETRLKQSEVVIRVSEFQKI